MADAAGISKSGERAEATFRQLTGATKPVERALGDAILHGHYIEVKKASSTTLNQVRAVKYITLVAYSTEREIWYVVPASEVVRQCAGKPRGQHTEIPFESATLSINTLSKFEVDPDADDVGKAITAAVADAVVEADRYPELRSLMEKVLADANKLSEDSRARVQLQLTSYGLSEGALSAV